MSEEGWGETEGRRRETEDEGRGTIHEARYGINSRGILLDKGEGFEYSWRLGRGEKTEKRIDVEAMVLGKNG